MDCLLSIFPNTIQPYARMFQSGRIIRQRLQCRLGSVRERRSKGRRERRRKTLGIFFHRFANLSRSRNWLQLQHFLQAGDVRHAHALLVIEAISISQLSLEGKVCSTMANAIPIRSDDRPGGSVWRLLPLCIEEAKRGDAGSDADVL